MFFWWGVGDDQEKMFKKPKRERENDHPPRREIHFKIRSSHLPQEKEKQTAKQASKQAGGKVGGWVGGVRRERMMKLLLVVMT